MLFFLSWISFWLWCLLNDLFGLSLSCIFLLSDLWCDYNIIESVERICVKINILAHSVIYSKVHHGIPHTQFREFSPLFFEFIEISWRQLLRFAFEFFYFRNASLFVGCIDYIFLGNILTWLWEKHWIVVNTLSLKWTRFGFILTDGNVYESTT